MLVESLSHLSTVHCSTTLALTDEDQHCSRQQKPHGELVDCCFAAAGSSAAAAGGALTSAVSFGSAMCVAKVGNWSRFRKRILPTCRCRQTHPHFPFPSLGFPVLFIFRHGTGAHWHYNTGRYTPEKRACRGLKRILTEKKNAPIQREKKRRQRRDGPTASGTNEGRDGGSSGK